MYARNLKECMSKSEFEERVRIVNRDGKKGATLGNVVMEETQTGSSLGYDDLTDDLNRYRGNRSAHGQLPILSHGNHRGGSDLIAACWLGAFGPNG
ncbi:hypothetical protein G5I_13546 [Acromyrmex echinatior]|uniref:Uncharacterized protein n=1 Tax=Acromyrmex echinatior TaxID=103372 RepID=F4X5B8_ACREC|nr:hypothetical protein G5I_13546 [Acromyrmex echinatior]